MDRYRRVVAARPALHVDQLPPALRREWKRVRFPGVRFAEAEYLQPYEFFNCHSYDVEAVAYLAADGTTVRPLPGREDVFAEALAGWREDQSEAAAQYRFEDRPDGT